MGSSCYGGYAIGKTYLFYASKQADFGFFEDKIKDENTVYQGSFCNRTSNLKSAQDQIYFIREMLKGKPEPQIYGSVARSDTNPQSFEWRHLYLQGIKVVLEGEEKSFQAISDKDGIFRFNNIPEGEYTVKPSPAENYKIYFPEEETIQILPDKTIVSGRGYGNFPYKSFYADFSLGWNNRIDGHVVDSAGKPFERYVIKLLPLSKANNEMIPENLKDSPDHHIKGFFVFGGETPGKYVLAVEVYTPSLNRVKKRFFYPNAETAAKAQIFDINPTTKLQNLKVEIPLTIRDINGEVLWSDGTSVGSRGWLVLKRLETENEKENVSFDWESTKDGKFTIQAFEGFEYWIHTEVTYFDTEGKFTETKVKPIKIKVDKTTESLKIVVDKPANFKCEKINDCVPSSEKAN
ncbi:MAG TPA: hypothetical protein VK308_09155 [Pyrinomonadaceae bacterium]|nr:hypothetical protein [Pyrinomonadaceae bacterium]